MSGYMSSQFLSNNQKMLNKKSMSTLPWGATRLTKQSVEQTDCSIYGATSLHKNWRLSGEKNKKCNVAYSKSENRLLMVHAARMLKMQILMRDDQTHITLPIQ